VLFAREADVSISRRKALMRPVSWTEHDVRMECEHCSGHVILDRRRFAKSVNGSVMCSVCGRYSVVRDRRSAAEDVSVERRTPAA
jgi:hypothetical protein